MIRDLLKRPVFRSAAYLSFVRSLSCVGCGFVGKVEAHHCIANRYSSEKHADAYAIPMCTECHAELHDNWHTWEEKHGSQWQHVAETLHEAIRVGVLVLDSKAAKELS